MNHLETKRLQLQKLVSSDLDWLLALHTNPEVMRFIWPNYPQAIDVALEEERLARMLAYNEDEQHFGYFAIRLKTNNKAIGWACLKHLDGGELIEIGYRLFPNYWGEGYATEAAIVLRDFGFNDLQLDKIVGITAIANEGSKKVLLKLGLKYIGRDFFYNTDVDFFEMTRMSENG